MATYPAIDGIATHGSDKILTGILRDDLEFHGLVLSEGGGIGTLVTERHAENQKEAGQMALKAGVDVGISYEPGYMDLLVESVNEGKVPMALVDRAVRRILRQKMALGLFERPYVNPDKVTDDAHRALALQVAHEGIVLLKNERNTLPLENEFLKSIAVIGPNADNVPNQLGDYTPRHVRQNVVTVLAGIKNKVGAKTQVYYVKGCSSLNDGADEIEAAKKRRGRRRWPWWWWVKTRRATVKGAMSRAWTCLAGRRI